MNIGLFLVFPFIIGSAAICSQNPFIKSYSLLPLSETAQPPTNIIPSTSSPTLAMTFTPSLQTPFGKVVDDGDMDFFRSGGDQFNSSEGFGGDFVWSTTTDENASVQVEWRPILQRCGTYKVEVFIPSGIKLTKSAFYQVGYRQGMTSRLVNQSENAGAWFSLGDFDFLPTSGTFLRLTNSTGEPPGPDLAIVFDAARWTLISPCSANQP